MKVKIVIDSTPNMYILAISQSKGNIYTLSKKLNLGKTKTNIKNIEINSKDIKSCFVEIDFRFWCFLLN